MVGLGLIYLFFGALHCFKAGGGGEERGVFTCLGGGRYVDALSWGGRSGGWSYILWPEKIKIWQW